MTHRGAFPRSINSPIALVTSPFFLQLVACLDLRMVRYKIRLVLTSEVGHSMQARATEVMTTRDRWSRMGLCKKKALPMEIFGRAFSKLLRVCSSFTSTSHTELLLFSAGLHDQADSEADLAG